MTVSKSRLVDSLHLPFREGFGEKPIFRGFQRFQKYGSHRKSGEKILKKTILYGIKGLTRFIINGTVVTEWRGCHHASELQYLNVQRASV